MPRLFSSRMKWCAAERRWWVHILSHWASVGFSPVETSMSNYFFPNKSETRIASWIIPTTVRRAQRNHNWILLWNDIFNSMRTPKRISFPLACLSGVAHPYSEKKHGSLFAFRYNGILLYSNGCWLKWRKSDKKNLFVQNGYEKKNQLNRPSLPKYILYIE